MSEIRNVTPSCTFTPGVVFNSTRRREAKRGQSGNLHESEGRDESLGITTKKKPRLELQVKIAKYILSLFGRIVLLFGQPVCLGLLSLCGKRLCKKGSPFGTRKTLSGLRAEVVLRLILLELTELEQSRASIICHVVIKFQPLVN
jgi:hypothetical protein